ncbi:MAG: hypothetical protein V4543_02745 [Bacteroidota bacterium]
MPAYSKLIGKLMGLPKTLLNMHYAFSRIEQRQQTQLALSGRALSDFNRTRTDIKTLHDAEFKVFSQFGDDGIIQHLVNNIEIPFEQQVFIEFGVENYTEANTRFLLINNNWSGLIMDGSAKNMAHVQNSPLYHQYDLQALNAFITAENINSLIASAGISGEIGLLHIDIDGNDYWVWKAIKAVNPIIVIVEYNHIFGPDKPYTVPYDPAFYRTEKHHSNLYFGTSLLSICDLAAELGYDFVGCSLTGINAYFVRKDKNFMPALTAGQGFVDARVRQSRNAEGRLTYLRGEDRLKAIKGMPVFNTRTGKTETL